MKCIFCGHESDTEVHFVDYQGEPTPVCDDYVACLKRFEIKKDLEVKSEQNQ